eukprot:CAMPEP_0202966634 /NCGR_PEP_ID=MMETSP1396-20130829/11165_1 /ASSEMBLY_ACC=CAM_ASM_000872 /TAXON_ID= /ORGANISM="Pseudokeronopsis sp., Strain Brazil" /LENGTH=99 /DNA_ID=CAMNT_0049690763 /DNA_START=509 /DNA_END=804 /DNA_ORIENTATION=+
MDCHEIGYKNFDLGLIKQVNPVVSNLNSDRMFMQIIIRTGFLVNMLFKAVKPFIHEVTLSKFRFVGYNYKEELEKFIDLHQIPEDYGGSGPSLDSVDWA